MISLPWPFGAVAKRPSIRTASSANQRKNSAAYAISAFDSAIGLPISSVMTSASSSARAPIFSHARRRISPRSRGGWAAHSACTATHASSAAVASSGVASATSAKLSPVGGILDRECRAAARVAPLAADEQLRRDRLDGGLLLRCGDGAHAATVSVPSSCEIATSSE